MHYKIINFLALILLLFFQCSRSSLPDVPFIVDINPYMCKYRDIKMVTNCYELWKFHDFKMNLPKLLATRFVSAYKIYGMDKLKFCCQILLV